MKKSNHFTPPVPYEEISLKEILAETHHPRYHRVPVRDERHEFQRLYDSLFSLT